MGGSRMMVRLCAILLIGATAATALPSFTPLSNAPPVNATSGCRDTCGPKGKGDCCDAEAQCTFFSRGDGAIQWWQCYKLSAGDSAVHNLTTRTGGTCDEGDNCWDLRMQNVPGCTSGWTLHGLWPQWAESCSQEEFDPSKVADLMDQLKKYWPSCSGAAQDFWSHEWKKHGTCSGMTQHDYFSEALKLLGQQRSSCNGGSSCNVCYTKDLSSTMDCNSR